MLAWMVASALLLALVLMKPPAFNALEKGEIRRELGKTDDSCTRPAPSFPGVYVLGSFAHDRGCLDAGYVHPHGVVASLGQASPVLGKTFHEGSPEAKKQAALAWSREVLFQNRALASAPRGLGGKDEPAFAPPSAQVRGDGTLVVELWVEEPAGMLAQTTYSRYRVIFSASGDVTERTLLATHSVRLR